MRRYFLSVFIVLVTLTLAPFGGTLAQDSDMQIAFPPSVYHVVGTITIFGTVNPPDLQAYFLEVTDYAAYTANPDTALWTPVTLPVRAAVTDGALATWDTGTVIDGLYMLRLRAALRGGGARFAAVGPIRVANTDPNASGNVQTAPPSVGIGGEAPVTPTPAAEPSGIVIVPRPATVNPLPIPVGGQFDSFDEEAAELIRAAGLTWIKWQIPFVVGDFSLITVARDRVNWSHERGFRALLSVKGNKDELAAMGAAYYAEYASFVGELARLQPEAIQIWNEQNLDREWPNGQIDPRRYLALLQPAYETIKSIDPTVQVITGAPSPTGAESVFGTDAVWNDDRYYNGMASAGVANFTDCIGIHYNEGIIAPAQLGGDPRGDYPTYYLGSMMDRAAFPFRASNKPLCFSEMGYLSPEGYGALPQGFEWGQNTSVAEQAQWLRDAIQIAAQRQNPSVNLLIIFNVNFTRFVDGDPQGGFGIIRPDGSCPACDAIATLRTG
ncbi:MAG: hypothetical protein SGI73_18825 [Chloroflexota bacterium]|nr:hypothetical protein [Chloroflexota bacterium]